MASNLAPFQNEPFTDFSDEANREKMQAALEKVAADFGKVRPFGS